MTLFAYRERDDAATRLNPLVKIALTTALALSLATPSEHPLATTGLLSGLLVLMGTIARLPLKPYGKRMGFFLAMALVIGLAKHLSEGNWVVTTTAVLRFLAYVLMGLLLADTTAPDDLARSLGSLVARVRSRAGYRFAVTVEVALRSFAIIFEVSDEVVQARRARLERPWRHPLGRMLSLGAVLVAAMIDRGECLANAMQARQIDPEAPREARPFTKSDAFVLAGGLSVIVFLRVIA